MKFKATNLCKAFLKPIKVDILKNINLEVGAEESVAIMGTSGVGKSTLLHILGTLEKPDSGTLVFGEDPHQNLTQIRNQEVGFIFQSFFLIDHLTVLQNVLMPAKIARKPLNKKSEAYLRALELLKRVGLYDRRNQLTKTLSGGEKQRACIARALCNNPSIIFADEPTGNLDQETSKIVQDLLLETIRIEKKSLIVVTHDEKFAASCDRVYHLKEGVLTQDQACFFFD
ncbi:MAG: Lipoprotein-releasing system ATP-binding protein LolD [Chlamydiae bacterium]|nr:Lipoprotein-releasing system ATP-binding protein LolD [Chlamydiota bacterium]